jgi:hypothetical protein
VKALLLPYISVNLLVAVPAKHALALLAERLVAFFTLFLVFHVPLNKLAGFNQ